MKRVAAMRIGVWVAMMLGVAVLMGSSVAMAQGSEEKPPQSPADLGETPSPDAEVPAALGAQAVKEATASGG